MSSSSGRPPALSNASVVRLVQHLYNFQHVDVTSVKSLPSYDDRNYYFRGAELPVKNLSLLQAGKGVAHQNGVTYPNDISQASEFVLKIFNSLHTSLDATRGISAILSFLHCKGFTYTEQLLTKQGDYIPSLTQSELSKFEDDKVIVSQNEDLPCGIRVLRYIPGELFDKIDKKYLTPKLMFDVGVLVGKVDAALQDGFDNSAIKDRLSHWDLACLLDIREHLPLIDDPDKRAIVEKILKLYEDFVVPKMSSFRKAYLHGDPNGMNVVVNKSDVEGEYEVTGLIDFDDATYSYRVFDLGLLLMYIMTENLNPVGYASPVEFVRPMAEGYVQQFPLTPEEMGCLYYVVLGRCCQSAVMGEVSYMAEPWNDYLLFTPNKCWKLIKILFSMEKEDVDKIWNVLI